MHPTELPPNLESCISGHQSASWERSQRACPNRPWTDPPIEMTVRSAELCGFLEFLEPKRQPVPIGSILKPSRPIDERSGDPLEPEFEERTIVDFEQPIGDMYSVIGVDADQVGVEGGMVELRQGQAVRYDRPSKLLVRVHDDMGGIEQPWLGQMGDRVWSSATRAAKIRAVSTPERKCIGGPE